MSQQSAIQIESLFKVADAEYASCELDAYFDLSYLVRTKPCTFDSELHDEPNTIARKPTMKFSAASMPNDQRKWRAIHRMAREQQISIPLLSRDKTRLPGRAKMPRDERILEVNREIVKRKNR
jgi:hypothetical protein